MKIVILTPSVADVAEIAVKLGSEGLRGFCASWPNRLDGILTVRMPKTIYK